MKEAGIGVPMCLPRAQDGAPSETLNAVTHLHLDGLFENRRHFKTALTLDCYGVTPEESGLPPDPTRAPPRPPSRQPDPQHLTMELFLRKPLVDGRCGVAYRVEVLRVLPRDGQEISDLLCLL